MDIKALLEKQADTAAYLVDCMKSGAPVTKQDLRFLETWNSLQKAQAALAAGKPMPKCGRAGRRKRVYTGGWK